MFFKIKNMFLKKIDQYLLKNLLIFSAFYTLIPTFILWIVQSRHIFEMAIGSKTSILVILKLSSFLIPAILPHIVPFAILLASISVLLRLYHDSEIIILWSSGLSPKNLIKSFMIIGLMGMIFVFIINAFIAPYMSRHLKIELLNVKNDIIKTALKPGVLQNIPNGNLTIYIDKISGDSFIEGFYLQQQTPDNQIRIFTAKQALLTEENGNFKLLLLKGRIVNWHYHINSSEQKQNTAPTILDFDKFTLNISDVINSFNNSQDIQFKARDYSIKDLLTAKYAQNPHEKRRFIANGHEQIIASFSPIIFILLSLVFMLRPLPPRGFKYSLILKTMLIAVLLKVSSSALHNAADNNLNIMYVSYGMHFMIIIFMTLFMFTKKTVKLF
jgi:lipopolysaccharide export system permease protein